MKQNSSIVIAGGSLAGIATAIRLKQSGFDPVVIEKSRFPRPKLCGEFLGPDSFPCLKTLGVLEEIQDKAYGPVKKVFFYDRNGRCLKIHLSWMSRKYPFALAIPRERLDHLLMQKAKSMGVQTLEQTRVFPAISISDKRFKLSVQTLNSEVQILEADIVIDATGRHGGLFLESEQKDNSQCKLVRDKNMIGLQCHAVTSNLSQPDLHMFFFPGGYGGIQPISANTVNICMLTRPENPQGNLPLLSRSFENIMADTICQNPIAAEILDGSRLGGEILTTANLNLSLPDQKSGLLRIGDAMITIDPFTGSGMAHALETGILAAEITVAGLAKNQTYPEIQQAYQRKYRQKFGWRLSLLKSFRPLLFSEKLQTFSWPVIKPLLPTLATVFR